MITPAFLKIFRPDLDFFLGGGGLNPAGKSNADRKLELPSVNLLRAFICQLQAPTGHTKIWI